MPGTYVVDRTARIVRVTLTGTLATDEMLAIISDAARDIGQNGFDVFSDHAGLDTPATPEQIHAIVAHLGAMGETFRGARWAIVVRRAVSFGMMRMLAAYAASIPMDVDVFTDAPEAEAWLRERRPGPAAPAEA